MVSTQQQAAVTMNVSRVKAMSRDELAALFASLPAPAAPSFAGFFRGIIPDYAANDWHAAIALLGLGQWQGKMYTPAGDADSKGEGYNVFHDAEGRIVHIGQFGWRIEQSTIDQKRSLVMYYRDYESWGGSHDLIDEVRQLSEGIHVGVYHTKEPIPGFTPRPGEGRSGTEFFILVKQSSNWEPFKQS